MGVLVLLCSAACAVAATHAAGKLPVLEIVFLLERERAEDYQCIAFQSVYGMPIKGVIRV